MPAYFFDTSALVKRYVSEVGSTWVKSVLDPAAGNYVSVALITGVEVISSVTRRQRGGSISLADATVMLADFRADFGSQYRRVPITPALITLAMQMAEVHGLRGYDAVQLAAALYVNGQRLARGLPVPTVISADADLTAAAVAEGLGVDDPNAHP